MQPAIANGLSAEANALVAYGKIQTASGLMIQPFDLNPELIDINDIAHALAHQCRFAGHTQMFYSVAQHSVAVSELAPGLTWKVRPDQVRLTALEGLMHDATEAYLIDLPRPIKHQPAMQPYRDAEARAYGVIAAKFGLPVEMSEAVHLADNRQLEIEARSLLIPTPSWVTVRGERIERVWAPEEARMRFLQRFYQLQAVTK